MKTAVCAVVKNEQSTILQWIAYHCIVGFDTVLLLDDQSTDLTASLGQWASRFCDVRVAAFEERGEKRQVDAYLRVCRDNHREFDHIAFIDADEYLVPRTDETLEALLSRCHDHAGISVPWLMFGSSHHVGKPDGLVIDDFQRRSPFGFSPNRHFKSIVRPGAVVDAMNPHAFGVTGSYCLPDGSQAAWDGPGVLQSYPDASPWMIHHYFTRSRAHWSDRMSRGQLGQFVRTWTDFDWYDRNDVHDQTAAVFSPQVKRWLAAMDRDEAARRRASPPWVCQDRLDGLARLRPHPARMAAEDWSAAIA